MKLERTSESVYGSSTDHLNNTIERKIKIMEQNDWAYEGSTGITETAGGGFVTILHFIRLPQEPVDE